MSEEEPKIKTINEYLDAVKKLTDDKPGYIFRGQADKDWKLVSSAQRRITDHNENVSFVDFIEYNKDLITNTRKKGHGHDGSRDLDDLEVLAKLQHLGAATAFIDFTKNLFIALWFAVDSCQGKDGKVFIVRSNDNTKFKMVDEQKQEEKNNIDYFLRTSDADKSIQKPLYWLWEAQSLHGERIIKQSSIFILARKKYKRAITMKSSLTKGRKKKSRQNWIDYMILKR